MATTDRQAAGVSVSARPLWRLRLTRALPRYLLYGICSAGLLASARYAIAPPDPPAPNARARSPRPPDLAAEGYAALFARRYLTWDASEPRQSEELLAPMAGSEVDPDAGLSLPAAGAQHVLWAEVVQARALGAGGHVYTVAVQTDASGVLYLTVGVVRGANGALSLSGYPAFVGAPAADPARPPARSPEVADDALVTVVERALRNYLAASPGELAADLTDRARVSVPPLAMTLDSMEHLVWASGRRSVVATVEARDARGTRYTLAYELDVVLVEGRWEVAAIGMDPDS